MPKVKQIPIELRDCRSRKAIEQALRDGACVRMGRLSAMLRPFYSLGFYVDWEGDGEICPNDTFVLESELLYATREVGEAYREHLSSDQIDDLYYNASDIAWRWHERDKHAETVPSPESICRDRKSGGSPITRDTSARAMSLLADMRRKTRVTNAEARIASLTTAPADVVKHAVFEHAVWMTSPETFKLDPATLWPLAADVSVKEVVFALPENVAVTISPSILRGARSVLGKKPDLRATVDFSGLHLRWGEFGGLDLRESRHQNAKFDPSAVFVALERKAA